MGKNIHTAPIKTVVCHANSLYVFNTQRVITPIGTQLSATYHLITILPDNLMVAEVGPGDAKIQLVCMNREGDRGYL